MSDHELDNERLRTELAALRSELEQSRDQVKRLREVLARVIANDPSDAIVFVIEVDKDVMEEARALAQTQEQAK